MDFQVRILVTVPNAFSDNSFINPVGARSVFEISKDKKWQNSSGSSSNGRGNPLEPSWLGVGNSKTRTLPQQLTIIYCSIFRLYTVARERVCKGLWTDKKRQPSSNWPLTYWQTDSFFQKSLIFICLYSGYRWGWCHLAKLLCHLSRVPNSQLYSLQSNLSLTKYECILFHFSLPVFFIMYSLKIGDLSRESPEGFVFNSYYTEV